MMCPILEPAEYWCISGNKRVSRTVLAPSKALYYKSSIIRSKKDPPCSMCCVLEPAEYWSICGSTCVAYYTLL